nr:MAG TPA: hypothetical protein [Caudoviricetes sp.]
MIFFCCVFIAFGILYICKISLIFYMPVYC